MKVYKFKLVKKFNNYTIYYDNEFKKYCRMDYVNPIWNMLLDDVFPSIELNNK